MTDTERGLLRAVVDNPDDDFPRLRYADWCEEHGKPEWANLIRVQCELAALQVDTRDYTFLGSEGKVELCLRSGKARQLAEQESALLGHFKVWRPDFHIPYSAWCCLGDVVWRRGFVEEVSCEADDWLEWVHQLADRHPLRSVRVFDLPTLDYREFDDHARRRHVFKALTAVTSPEVFTSSRFVGHRSAAASNIGNMDLVAKMHDLLRRDIRRGIEDRWKPIKFRWPSRDEQMRQSMQAMAAAADDIRQMLEEEADGADLD